MAHIRRLCIQSHPMHFWQLAKFLLDIQAIFVKSYLSALALEYSSSVRRGHSLSFLQRNSRVPSRHQCMPSSRDTGVVCPLGLASLKLLTPPKSQTCFPPERSVSVTSNLTCPLFHPPTLQPPTSPSTLPQPLNPAPFFRVTLWL